MSYSQYRVVEILLDAAKPLPPQIEAGLNLLSSEGWRVVSLEVVPRLVTQASRVRVMLEQVEDEAELEPVA